MTYKIISSGSQGNAVIINDSILIDCGVSFKCLKPYIRDLGIVLLTHSHTDHFNPATVRALHRERPGLRWGCGVWMVEPLIRAGVSERVIDVMDMEGETARSTNAMLYKNVAIVEPVRLPHDVPNCGWKIRAGGESIFYATDCSTLDGISAPHFDLYMIEANHTEAEIEARIAEKLAAGQFAYEMRAKRNHLSQEQAEAWLAANAGPNSRFVWLHQHRDKDKQETTQC